MAKSRTTNSILNFCAGIGGQLLTTVLRFVVRTVFIQTLGKSYLGINGLFSDILTMLSLTELGLDTAINFKLYKPLAEHDEKRVRVLMKFYRDAYRVVGCVILLLGLCVIPLLPFLIKEYDSLGELGINAVQIFLLYLANSVCSYLFFASRSAIVKADQKTYILTIADYGITVGSAVLQIVILLTTQNFILYTASNVAFAILRNLVNATIAKKQYAYAFQPENDRLSAAEIKDTFKDLGALFVYKVNGVVLKATDNMVLSSFIGLSIVGMYSNYLILYTTIRQFLVKAYTAVKASTGNLFAVSDVDVKYRFFEVMNFVSALLYGTACIGVAVVADELIETWLGADYVLPQPFALLMGIEIIFLGLKQNLGQMRNVSGAFRQGWWRPLMAIVINLGVSIAAVQKFGINGVLVGTVSADFLANFTFDPVIIHKYAFNNYRPVSEYYLRNLKYAIVLVVVGVADRFICTHFLVGCGWLSVVVHAAICGVSVPLVFVVVFHNRHEYRYLVAKLKPLKKRIMGKRA